LYGLYEVLVHISEQNNAGASEELRAVREDLCLGKLPIPDARRLTENSLRGIDFRGAIADEVRALDLAADAVIARIRSVATLQHELGVLVAHQPEHMSSERQDLESKVESEKAAIRAELNSLTSRAKEVVIAASRLAIPAILAGWDKDELLRHMQEAVNRAVERVIREQTSLRNDTLPMHEWPAPSSVHPSKHTT
jgi:hypothetical protein